MNQIHFQKEAINIKVDQNLSIWGMQENRLQGLTAFFMTTQLITDNRMLDCLHKYNILDLIQTIIYIPLSKSCECTMNIEHTTFYKTIMNEYLRTSRLNYLETHT